MLQQKTKSLLRKHLQYSWLRPENALINTMRAKSLLTYPIVKGERAIDISCGDGVSSFIAYGGELSPENDMFQSINVDGQRTAETDHFDYFDPDAYNLQVVNKPEAFFSTGTDWKQSMLQKAAVLDVYERLCELDNNQALPFVDASYDYIYTNSIYWVDKIKFHFSELVRIADADAKILLHVKTPKMFEYHASSFAPMFGKEFARIIDAGRHDSYKGLLSLDEYIKLGNGHDSISVEAVLPVYDDIVGKIWDIGLRPLFPALSKMSQAIPQSAREECKSLWVDQLFALLEEFTCTHQTDVDKAMEYLIVFRKMR